MSSLHIDSALTVDSVDLNQVLRDRLGRQRTCPVKRNGIGFDTGERDMRRIWDFDT
jgi:hypothetical protein